MRRAFATTTAISTATTTTTTTSAPLRAVITRSGDAAAATTLAEALETQWRHGFPQTPKGVSAYTSGFHPYLAGLQPASARMVLPLLGVPRGGLLLDPTCPLCEAAPDSMWHRLWECQHPDVVV